jgi:beta-lactamase regulating signal transducer with metallopeptidase domain
MDFTEDELRFILMHELVHCKRKDLYYKFLILIAISMHWFNPIAYLIASVSLQISFG